MRNSLQTTLAVLAVSLLALPAAHADAAKRNKPRAVKARASADGAGAIATATASCPGGSSAKKGPWRALAGGFVLTTGNGIVYGSQRVGARGWRASAQSLAGRIDLAAYVYCQRGVSKPKAVSASIATPGVSQIGPGAVAKCRTGSAVGGGFSTPPPFSPTGAANTVIGSFPSGKRAWKAQVLTSQSSSVTSYVYCAKRDSKPKTKQAGPEPSSVVSLADEVAFSTSGYCPAGRFSPGGGGFLQRDATPTQYLMPIRSTQRPSSPASTKPPTPGYRGNVWEAHGRTVGSGSPVTLVAVALCG